MARAAWGSRLGFIFAVAGSAVGLANIWRFPYIAGMNGGGAFIAVYLLFLVLIGFPVFMAEILIGRTTQACPTGAFRQLGRHRAWGWAGSLTILTGFIVSSFYSAVAGWILGYLVEALRGQVSQFDSATQAVSHFDSLVGNPYWGIGFHFSFLIICVGVLYLGVREGIERFTKWMIPLLLVVLGVLVVKGLTMPGAQKGLAFLFTPQWDLLTPTAILMALGQAFFTLSLGQGTMVTYGSYIGDKKNLIKSCLPVVVMDTVVSLLAAVAVFTIVFSGDIEPDSGPGLIFHTLPVVFSELTGGYLLAVLFFLLVVLAAITSEISAMEPVVAYLIDEKRCNRHAAVALCGVGVFLLGVPSALSYSWLMGGVDFLAMMDYLASSILIPVGGFLAVFMVGWRWGVPKALTQLKLGASDFFQKNPWLEGYFWFCFKYSAPLLIVVVFLSALGVWG